MPTQRNIIGPASTVMVVVDMPNDFVTKGATFQSCQAT